MQESLGFRWEPCAGGVRLLRVYGDSPCPVVPPLVAGQPVAELGPYCFSEREPRPGQFWSSDNAPESAYPHAICGNFVESVTLPDSVTALHNGCFYNCRKLQWVALGANIQSLGSDLFTNCRVLEEFRVKASPDAPTGLDKLLGAVKEEIAAVFVPQGVPVARLVYPEYSETYDLNGPAHIFNFSIEGEGYRYRQCFRQKLPDFAAYDEAFPQATVSVAEESLCRIALGRLLFPHRLGAQAEERYLAYLRQNSALACRMAVSRRDLPVLRLLVAQQLTNADTAALCSRAGWSEGAAVLLGSGKKRTRKTYDDFDF